MASDKPFNYHSGLWMLLSHIIVSQNMPQTPKMTTVMIVKWIITWKKFSGLGKDAKSVVDFSAQF